MKTLTQKLKDLSIKVAAKKEVLKATLHNSSGEVASSEGGKVAITVVAVLALIVVVGIFLKAGGEFDVDGRNYIHKIWN